LAGAAGGFLFRAEFPPEDTRVVVSVPAAETAKKLSAPAPIAPRGADEALIELRMERSLESLSRLRPPAKAVDKKV
jgi:hypothetical protein